MALTADNCDQVELHVVHQVMATAFAMAPAELTSLIEQAHQVRRATAPFPVLTET